MLQCIGIACVPDHCQFEIIHLSTWLPVRMFEQNDEGISAFIAGIQWIYFGEEKKNPQDRDDRDQL